MEGLLHLAYFLLGKPKSADDIFIQPRSFCRRYSKLYSTIATCQWRHVALKNSFNVYLTAISPAIDAFPSEDSQQHQQDLGKM